MARPLCFLRFGSTSRLCIMPGKFNNVVDWLFFKTARSYAMAASFAVPYDPMFVDLEPILIFALNEFPLLYAPLYPMVLLISAEGDRMSSEGRIDLDTKKDD